MCPLPWHWLRVSLIQGTTRNTLAQNLAKMPSWAQGLLAPGNFLQGPQSITDSPVPHPVSGSAPSLTDSSPTRNMVYMVIGMISLAEGGSPPPRKRCTDSRESFRWPSIHSFSSPLAQVVHSRWNSPADAHRWVRCPCSSGQNLGRRPTLPGSCPKHWLVQSPK